MLLEDSKSNDVELNEFEATFIEMNEFKKRKIDNFVSQFISLDNIEVTSNAAERLFSRAKLYSSDRITLNYFLFYGTTEVFGM
jgi:hypothetical protein